MRIIGHLATPNLPSVGFTNSIGFVQELVTAQSLGVTRWARSCNRTNVNLVEVSMFHANYQQSAAIIEYSLAFLDDLKGRWAHPCGSNSMLQPPSKSSSPAVAPSNDSTARGHMASMLFAIDLITSMNCNPSWAHWLADPISTGQLRLSTDWLQQGISQLAPRDCKPALFVLNQQRGA
jgi:hypothetical protein